MYAVFLLFFFFWFLFNIFFFFCKLSQDIFLARLEALDKHIIEEYPHIWLDTYLFFTAICFVIATAAFSIIARAANLSMWYPLTMLVIPAIVGFITTRRRRTYYKKLATVRRIDKCIDNFNIHFYFYYSIMNHYKQN